MYGRQCKDGSRQLGQPHEALRDDRHIPSSSALFRRGWIGNYTKVCQAGSGARGQASSVLPFGSIYRLPKFRDYEAVGIATAGDMGPAAAAALSMR